jgi:hypothetical protein
MKIPFFVAEERFGESPVGFEKTIPLAGSLLRSSLLHGKKSIVLKF